MIRRDKTRVQLTLDNDVLNKAREYAQSVTLSSMVNRMLSEALGFQPPRELKARLPEIEGQEKEE